jgi:hypothetical protein
MGQRGRNEMKNFGRSHHPFVFLNMPASDWATQFLRAGASAFISSYGFLYDEDAYKFMKALYDRLLTGMAIGQATQESRTAIRSPGNPGWLSYRVYADVLVPLLEETSSLSK